MDSLLSPIFVLHDSENKLREFESANEIIQEFFDYRLSCYEARLTKKCQRLKQHQLFFRNRIKYLSERENYCELLCEHEKHKLEAKVEETLKFEKLKSEDVWNAELDNLNNAIKDILGCIVR
ncbi:DNA topoisomerase 2 [Trifolium repens]|nr:DNA topoisomerase 2 [Trifolium repens]